MTKLYEYFNVVGGSDTLAGYAFPEVHKFDASAFYNWEQDNLPILDLENRSDVLKQHMGLTNHTGVTLTVSADAPKSASANNVYQTVQDALAVVPRRLKFPVLIEICDFGNLGDLHINDIQCEGDGALQIESRQYLESYTTVAGTVSESSAYGPTALQTLPATINDNNPSKKFYSDLSSASSTRLSLTCSSTDKWNYHALCYTSKSPNSQEPTQLLGFSPFPRYNGTSFPPFLLNASQARFYALPYSERDEVTVSADVHPRTANGSGTSLFQLRSALNQYDVVTAAAWGCHFNKITINNSSRIKLKNIAVDSASGADYQYPKSMVYLCHTGIDIINSNVLFENVTVSRVKQTGVRLQDSSLSIKGQFIVNRIYDRTINRTRASEGTGVMAVDSTIAFDDSVGDGTNNFALGINTITKCGVGLHAINSHIAGGATCSGAVANAGSTDNDSTRFYVQGNGTGIKLVNSVYEVEGRTEVFCNIKGFDCYDSTVTLQQFSVEFNQEEGFYLNNSTLFYGKDAEEFETAISGTVKPAYTCDYNGINLHADKNSTVQVADNVAVHTKLDLWGGAFSGAIPSNFVMTNHGTNGIGNYAAPIILVTENSNADIMHLAVAANGQSDGGAGTCVRAVSNSNVALRGSGKSSTCLGTYGVVRLSKNWTTAAAAAVDNSHIVFTGPTKISKVGVGALAQSNSHVSFGPPTSDYVSWVPAVDRYDLGSTTNHTKIDIHSNRACVVANDKSTISMRHLGGSSLDAINSVDSKENYDLSAAFTTATSGSYLRFSPNGFTAKVGYDFYGGTYFDSFGRQTDAFADANHYLATTGGMCVRAVGSSKVEVNGVNFRVDGSLASDLSGVCYNYNGTGCEFTNNTLSGIVGSPTSNICDLVTNCCDPVVTTTVAPTTTTIAATTTTTEAITTTTITTTDITPPDSTVTTETLTMDSGLDANYNVDGDIEFSCIGTRIHMWNIADTSRLHAANIILNGNNPATECANNSFHGPIGRWANGAACDYYGKYGFASSAIATFEDQPPSVDSFYNLGVFRIVGSHRGYLKTYSEVDYGGHPIQSQLVGGGSPLDQINCQGYQTMFDAAINTVGAEDLVTAHVGLEPGLTPGAEPVFGRGLAGLPGDPGKLNGVVSHARMAEGAGMLWDEGQLHPVLPLPPLHLDWQGYIRNWVDESAVSLFANARHGANKKVNLLSIYRSSTSADIGGEGRDTTTGNPTFGVGVRSLNLFDLNRLV